MTGGLLQLVATGTQDIYLTGNPHISFFKILYRRHTEFSMVDYPILMSNEQDFGSIHTMTIPQIADLADKMMLMIDIEEPVLKKKEATLGNLKNILNEYSIYLPESYPYKDSDVVTYNDIFVNNSILTDLITKRAVDLKSKHMETQKMIERLTLSHIQLDDRNNFPYIALHINRMDGNRMDGNRYDPDGYILTTDYGKNLYINHDLIDPAVYHNSKDVFVQTIYDGTVEVPIIVFADQISFNPINSPDDLPNDGTKYGLLIGVNIYRDLLRKKNDLANNMVSGKKKMTRLVNLQSQGILFCNNKYDDDPITTDDLIESKYLIGYYIFETTDYSEEAAKITQKLLSIPFNAFDTSEHFTINRYELNKNAFLDDEGEYLLISCINDGAISKGRIKNTILIGSDNILRNDRSIGYARCKIFRDMDVHMIEGTKVIKSNITKSIRAITDFNLRWYNGIKDNGIQNNGIQNNDNYSDVQLELSFLRAYYEDLMNGWSYSTERMNERSYIYRLENTKLSNAVEVKNMLYDQLIGYIIYCDKKKYSNEYYKYFILWMNDGKKAILNPNLRPNTTSDNVMFNREKLYAMGRYDIFIGNNTIDAFGLLDNMDGEQDIRYMIDRSEWNERSGYEIFEDQSIDDNSYLKDPNNYVDNNESIVCGNQCDIISGNNTRYCDGKGTALNREIEFTHILSLIERSQSIAHNISVLDFFENHLISYCNRTSRTFIFGKIYGYHLMRTYIDINYNISIMNLVKPITMIRDEIIGLIESTIANVYKYVNNMLICPLIGMGGATEPVYETIGYRLDYKLFGSTSKQVERRAKYYCGIDQKYVLCTIYRLRFIEEHFLGDVIVENEINVDPDKTLHTIHNEHVNLSADLKSYIIENNSWLNPLQWYQVMDIYKSALDSFGIQNVGRQCIINFMPFIIAFHYSQNINTIINSYENTNMLLSAGKMIQKEISFVSRTNIGSNGWPGSYLLATDIGRGGRCPFHGAIDPHKSSVYNSFLKNNMVETMDGECMICWKAYCLNNLCEKMFERCHIMEGIQLNDKLSTETIYIFRKDECLTDEISGIRFEKLIDLALYRIATIYRRYAALTARIIEDDDRYMIFKSSNFPENGNHIMRDRMIRYMEEVRDIRNRTGINIDWYHMNQLIGIIMFGTPKVENQKNKILLERMDMKPEDMIMARNIMDENDDMSASSWHINSDQYTYLRKNIDILRKIQGYMIGRTNQTIGAIINIMKTDERDIIREMYYSLETYMDLKYIDGDHFNRVNDMNDLRNTFTNPLVRVLNEFRELNIYYRMMLIRYKKRRFMLDIYHKNTDDVNMFDFSEEMVQKYLEGIVTAVKNSKVYGPMSRHNTHDYSEYYFQPNMSHDTMTNGRMMNGRATMLSYEEICRIIYLLGMQSSIDTTYMIDVKTIVFIPESANHGQNYLHYSSMKHRYDMHLNKWSIEYNLQPIYNESIYCRTIRSCRTIVDFLYQKKMVDSSPHIARNIISSPHLILEEIFDKTYDTRRMTPKISKWYDDHRHIEGIVDSIRRIISKIAPNSLWNNLENSMILGSAIHRITNIIKIIRRYKGLKYHESIIRRLYDEIDRKIGMKNVENILTEWLAGLYKMLLEIDGDDSMATILDRMICGSSNYIVRMVDAYRRMPKKTIDLMKFNKNANRFNNFCDIDNVILFMMHTDNQTVLDIYDDMSIANNIMDGKSFIEHTTATLTRKKEEIKRMLDGISTANNIFHNSELYQKIINLLKGSYPNHGWVKYLGYRIIELVELMVDKQIITTVNSDLMLLMDRMTVTTAHRRGVDQMIGNIPELYTYDRNLAPRIRLYIDFYPWFNKSVQSNIPLVGTIYSKVNLRLKYRDLVDVFCIEDPSLILVKPRMTTQLLCRYIYLEKAERTIFATTKMEQIIEKFYYSGAILKTAADLYDYEKTGSKRYLQNAFKLSDPTKYVLFKVRLLKKYQTDAEKINDAINWDNINTIGGKNIVKRMLIELGGATRENFKECAYYQTYHPITRNVHPLENGEMIYSFAIHPINLHPSGTSNMTELRNMNVVIELEDWFVNVFNDGVKYTNLNTLTIELNCWACHYNVLAHMSGFCALRFSDMAKKT